MLITMNPPRKPVWIPLLVALLFPLSLRGAEPARPNVLLIMADDLNNDLGCYGHTNIRTPQFDRLAARSVRFDRAYCQYPVCNPSRASMLSGRRSESTGIVDNITPPRSKLPNATFLPEYFRQHGYRTLKVGKIYHTGDPFEDPASWDVDIRETSDAKKPPAEQILRRLPGSGIVLRDDDAVTWDGFVARRGVEMLAEAAAQPDLPFFLAIGFRRPHTPYIAPKKYFDLYPPASMTFADEPAEHLAHIPSLALTYRHDFERLEPDLRPTVASAYYASLSFIDAQTRMILDALDDGDLWKNTIVVFVSDHGYHLGEHGGLWHKMTLFEQSARVPLLVAAPGKPAGVSPRLVELVDLYPTLVELCALPPAAELEGDSFAPLLDKPQRPWKQAAFTVVCRGENSNPGKPLNPQQLGRSIRTPRWRYTAWYDGTAELYDHDNDPRELHNLAIEESHRQDVAQLEQQLDAGWPAARAELLRSAGP